MEGRVKKPEKGTDGVERHLNEYRREGTLIYVHIEGDFAASVAGMSVTAPAAAINGRKPEVVRKEKHGQECFF